MVDVSFGFFSELGTGLSLSVGSPMLATSSWPSFMIIIAKCIAYCIHCAAVSLVMHSAPFGTLIASSFV